MVIILPLLKDLFEEALQKHKVVRKGRPPGRRPRKSRPTGFAHVTMVLCSECKQGFTYQYYWLDRFDNKHKTTAVNIKDLRDKVIERGWDWFVDNKILAQNTLKKNKVPYTLLDLQ